jgi:hypothetical protein
MRYNMKKTLKENFYLKAFLINFLAAAFAFGWTIIGHGGLFSLAGDFNSQQISFAMYANEAIKSGNVVWDYSLDLGSNFIGGMAFYILGNPSFWVSLLFPAKWFMYIVGWLYVLKYAFAGLFAFTYIRRYVKKPEAALIASMLYAFSGYSAEALLFYHFHDVVYLFPLMLITLDDLMQKKRRGPFILATFLNAVVSYYFLVGEVIFLAIYFLIRYHGDSIKKFFSNLISALWEGVLGVGAGLVLLLPAACFTMQNPRVKFDYMGNNSLVFSGERYLYILKGLLFPGEVMSYQSSVIQSNFSTCSAYLPMIGLILVIAFVMLHKKHWLTKMLTAILLCALIPILNASFGLFAGLYCRWYYMAVLIMALASAMVIDEWMAETAVFSAPTPVQRAVKKSSIIWGIVAAAFVLFLLFVPWSSSEESKIYDYALFAGCAAVCGAGIVVTWYIFCKANKKRILALFMAIFFFAFGTTGAAVAIYQGGSVNTPQDIYSKVNETADLDMGDYSYRYTNHDNEECLVNDLQGAGCFCSTVSGSIFRLYTAIGLSRDVKSPDAPDGFNALVSAKYTFETSPREDEEPVKTIETSTDTYYVYSDESVPPIGYTYDTYMTASEFEDTNDDTKAILMFKTLVIPDDKEDEVAAVLRHYDASVDGTAKVSDVESIGYAHQKECSTDYFRTTDSFGSTITAENDTYAFYSIPNDSGWSAEVNGEEAEIIDINGLMAVRISAGENHIVFHYKVPGFKVGLMGTAASVVIAAVYVGYNVRKKRRKIK